MNKQLFDYSSDKFWSDFEVGFQNFLLECCTDLKYELAEKTNALYIYINGITEAPVINLDVEREAAEDNDGLFQVNFEAMDKAFELFKTQKNSFSNQELEDKLINHISNSIVSIKNHSCFKELFHDQLSIYLITYSKKITLVTEIYK